MIRFTTRMLSVVAILAMFSLTTNAQDIERTFSVSAGGKLEIDFETGGDIQISG